VISKPVPAHSFYHTCRYIANKPGAELLIAEGVRSNDFKAMAEDFLNQQQLRPSKEKACFHSILSFYPGEKPSDEQLREIARKYLDRLGIVNTQIAVSKHTDKAHLHLHIVANMVNNEGKAISDSWIGLRGKKIAQKLTQEYKLIPALEKNLKLTHLQALSQSEADKYKIFQAIAENLPYCRTMEELEKRLLKLGIHMQYKLKGQTQERQGVSFKIGNVCFKGSQVDRKFSLAGLEKTITAQQKQVQDQQQTPTQTPDLRDHSRKQRPRIPRPSPPSTQSEILDNGLAYEMAKGMGKAIEILLKSEETGDQVPYELTEDYLKRKRKRSQRHRH